MARNYVAIHEAGHAVVGMLLGATLDEVTILPNEDKGSAGHAINDHGIPLHHIGGEDWGLMSRAICSLAGHAATIKLGHDETPEDAGAGNDYLNARFLLDSITGGGDIAPLMARAWATTQLIVDMAWQSIEMVAEMLEEHDTITGEEIREMLDISSVPAWVTAARDKPD